jgi:hypothetical protein
MTLEGCSEVVRVGLRFEGQEEALVEREVSTAAGHQSACIAATDLAGTGVGAIDAACGNGWQMCFSIGRMQIGANLLAGCPTIEVGDHGKAVLLRAPAHYYSAHASFLLCFISYHLRVALAGERL